MEMKFNQIQDVLQELVFTTKEFTIQDVNIFDIINLACTHYVNNEQGFNKVDPKDVAIIAFTTKFDTLEFSIKSGGGNNTGKQQNGNSSKSKVNEGNGNEKQKGILKW
eukprot:12382500-Ditylum_brightwellii.AAC.1